MEPTHGLFLVLIRQIMEPTGTVYDIVRKIREYNEENAQGLCTHTVVEVVCDSYNRPVYEVCRSCGKRLD